MLHPWLNNRDIIGSMASTVAPVSSNGQIEIDGRSIINLPLKLDAISCMEVYRVGSLLLFTFLVLRAVYLSHVRVIR